MSSDLPIIHGRQEHSLETITQKLQEDPRNIDAAIAVLGEVGFFHNSDNPIHLKLYQFVTGIELSTGRQKWPSKSLQHPNAKKVFRYHLNSLDLESPVQIGFQLAIDNWFRLEPLLGPNYEDEILTVPQWYAKQKKLL